MHWSRARLLPALLVFAGNPPVQGSCPADFALVGGTLIDGRGGPPLRDATVLVACGRIKAIGVRSAVRLPAGTPTIDASGQYVLPGFIDTNVHLTPYNFAVIDSSAEPLLREAARRGARELLERGITSVLDSYGLLPILLAVRDSSGDGTIGARLSFAGNIIGWGDPWSYSFSGSTGGRPRNGFTERMSRAVTQGTGEGLIGLMPDSLAVLLQHYIAKGVDFVKIGVTTHTSDPAPILFDPDALAAMVRAAHARGKPVQVHAGSPGALLMAVRAGVDLVQHPEVTGTYRMTDGFVRELVARRVVCAMLVADITGARWAAFQEHLAAGGRMWPAEMPLERLRARSDSLRRAGVNLAALPRTSGLTTFENRRANAQLLIRKGCRVSVATDDVIGSEGRHVMGERTLNAIEGLVELGMTPLQAITAATKNGALAAGRLGDFGTLEQGKRADLVVLREDPLADIRNIRTRVLVVRDGVRFAPR